ncbi:hypothetical protein [Rhodoferax sp.]|uniref:hypothetical protein n=1 Tax=Rhodoferax sp. TaxID=50421 RepID=UPI00374D0D52
MALPGIIFQSDAKVAALRQCGEEWELLDAQGGVLHRASRVVFANAGGALALLETLQENLPTLNLGASQLPVMRGVRGQVSWARHSELTDAAFAPFPVNGAGSIVPWVPIEADGAQGLAWFVGASYQPDSQPAAPEEKNHAANLARLHKLNPKLGQAWPSSLSQVRSTPEKTRVASPLTGCRWWVRSTKLITPACGYVLAWVPGV